MAEIRTIAVIGAGAIGRGIAYAAALGGYRTILEDILPSSLRTAAAELREHLARAADLDRRRSHRPRNCLCCRTGRLPYYPGRHFAFQFAHRRRGITRAPSQGR